jgi:mono/diheme cytochrome c family protein
MRPIGAGAKVVLGDFYRGQTSFSQKCAACHGQDGKGGPVGPKLDGLTLSLPAAQAQIDNGGATMPGGSSPAHRKATCSPSWRRS